MVSPASAPIDMTLAAQSIPLAANAVAVPTPAQQPRTGGTLNYIVTAEPPSFDGHRETTFAMIHPTAPHYSLLYKFDPKAYPPITLYEGRMES